MTVKPKFEVSRLAELEHKIPANPDAPYVIAFSEKAALTVLYKPGAADRQTPHEQDEVYVIARGAATLEVLGDVSPLQKGDAAFVAARCPHRFIDISPDFLCWAIFVN